MQIKCRECKREYTFNDEFGCSRELCGPLCDGKEIGRQEAAMLEIASKENEL